MKINQDYELQTGSSTGSAPEVISVHPSYTETYITINALAVGTMSLRVKANGGDAFETPDSNTIDLSTKRTFIVSDIQLDEIELSVSPNAAYDYRIEQR